MLGFIGRGGLAGACAGLVSGVFALLFAEATLDRAIELEHAASGDHGAELFTRDVQHVGLLVSSVLAGVAIGIIFGAVYALRHRHDPASDPWGRALRLGGAGFLGVTLLPFLRYPANPPGVGDPETVDVRTALWLAAIAIGVASMAAAAQVRSRLVASPPPVRDLATVAVVLLGLVVILLLPGSPEPAGAPADLLWTFRIQSLTATGILWASLGIGFGLAGWRASRQRQAAATAVVS